MTKLSSGVHMRLPGDVAVEADVERMIRVNHAGEYGAARIYAGQLAVLGKRPVAATIQHMAEQEARHLETFNQMIAKRHVRPSALLPLWHVGGYVLGAATALMGERAAMACTVAVEEVIDEHYREQQETLPESESALREVVEEFRQEELEHRDIGLQHEAELAAGYPVLSAGVKAISKAAIWLATRV